MAPERSARRALGAPRSGYLIGALAALVAAGFAFVPSTAQAIPASAAWEESLAISTYGAGYEGAYAALGVGSKVRWELERGLVGVELFLDHMFVDSPGNFRHDHPNGFSVYTPFRIGEYVRIRPFLGACSVFSFIEPHDKNTPRTDDIQFGVHGGVGAEVALVPEISLFADAKGIAYFGHERYATGWTASIDSELSVTGIVQANLGFQVHFTL